MASISNGDGESGGSSALWGCPKLSVFLLTAGHAQTRLGMCCKWCCKLLMARRNFFVRAQTAKALALILHHGYFQLTTKPLSPVSPFSPLSPGWPYSSQSPKFEQAQVLNHITYRCSNSSICSIETSGSSLSLECPPQESAYIFGLITYLSSFVSFASWKPWITTVTLVCKRLLKSLCSAQNFMSLTGFPSAPGAPAGPLSPIGPYRNLCDQFYT